MMDELLEQFLLEGRDLVAEAQAALASLARDARAEGALDRLFRAAHTLKGSVALFDMAPAESLLHAAESHLDAARRQEVPLGAADLDALVAVIDQTDRWIDAMERSGALDSAAPETSRRLARRIGAREGKTARGEARSAAAAATAPTALTALKEGEDQGGAWLALLSQRPALAHVARDRALTAFRYEPDTECFFRGEDPLALAASIPDLLGLALLPSGAAWADIEEFEPFRCDAVLEGLSAADPETVAAVFRFVPDQVVVTRLEAGTGEQERGPTAALPGGASTTLRVDGAKLDRLADQSGELNVAVRRLAPLVQRVRALDPALADELRRAEDEIERVAATLRASVAGVRLVSLEPVLRRLPRLAREAADSLGKAIRFDIDGETTQVDKQIADQLFEPLLHLVRNAVDHGIELPAERSAAAKPSEGHIKLSVAQDGEAISIHLADDGRGIDPAMIRTAAVTRGLLSAERAEAMTPDEALQLVFLPGFSTAAEATRLSGRGVGMDAVKVALERLGGTVRLESTVGAGTRAAIRLPASAITTPLLLVEAGGQVFGLRIDQVVETIRIPAGDLHEVGRGCACVIRDATVPVLDLAGLLGLESRPGRHARLVVTDAGTHRLALRVAAFGGRHEAVVRPHAGLLASVPAIAGTTMMPDGSVLLVLDLPELVS